MCLALIHAMIHASAHWPSVLEGVVELGRLSFALAYAGDAEYTRVPDNRKALFWMPVFVDRRSSECI